MLLRVQYPTFDYDYVDAATLDRLIVSRRIVKFLRPSETFWVDIEQGPIRGADGAYPDTVYAGPERRQPIFPM
jgi:hypothetical protein